MRVLSMNLAVARSKACMQFLHEVVCDICGLAKQAS